MSSNLFNFADIFDNAGTQDHARHVSLSVKFKSYNSQPTCNSITIILSVSGIWSFTTPLLQEAVMKKCAVYPTSLTCYNNLLTEEIR